jgi:hypothetical protein
MNESQSPLLNGCDFVSLAPLKERNAPRVVASGDARRSESYGRLREPSVGLAPSRPWLAFSVAGRALRWRARGTGAQVR